MVSAPKSIKIGSRKSHLARYQAYLVGQAIRRASPETQIEFFFKESLGDMNLQDPLWKMPEKGVFTEDFVQDLVLNKVDLVVHSWKDLPTQSRPHTEIIATLPRADCHDLLLVKKTSLAKAHEKKKWTILCSSPRRQLNLKSILRDLLPSPAPELHFENVRGNIPTRIRKLLDEGPDALVLAKAALDRLLGWKEIQSILPAHEIVEFGNLEKELRSQVEQCEWMLLPLSLDPPAAAQGALAIEISKQAAPEFKALLEKIHHELTFQDVNREREVLASYGGGCHQAIGVWCKSIGSSKVQSLRGLTDKGQSLSDWSLVTQQAELLEKKNSFPRDQKSDTLTEYEMLKNIVIPKDRDLLVTKAQALPEGFHPTPAQIVWTAGLTTWKKLAKRGIWVHGSSESLGDNLGANLNQLAGRPIQFLRLTHQDAGVPGSLATYKVALKKDLPNLAEFKTFYWSSGSIFRQVLRRFPQLAQAQHACGAGRTFQSIKELLPSNNPPLIFLSFDEWQKKLRRS